MSDRRTWLPVIGVVVLVAVVVGLVLLGRSDVEVESLTVAVPDGDGGTLELDAAVYRAEGVSARDPRPAVLLAHGFLGDRFGVDERARELANDGLVVLTWSARGFGSSEGRIGLADPAREIADVSRLVDLLAERPDVVADAADDPRVAIVGGSYGAGTALLAAAQEPRLDAVVAAAGWHSLARSLGPNGVVGPEPVAPGVLKTGWTSLLFTANALPDDLLAASGPGGSGPDDAAVSPDAPGAAADVCGRFTAEICALYLDVARDGVIGEQAREVLDARSPAGRLGDVAAPTLLLQGQDDTLFDLTESRRNAREIAAAGVPVRMRWIAGGHEVVGGAGTAQMREEVDAWLDRWLRDGTGGAASSPVGFAWTDSAADAVREADELPGGGSGDVLRFAAAAGGRLVTSGDGGVADPAARAVQVPLTSPPGGQPAALSTLPGAGALAGFLPATDIPGQHVTLTSDPLTEDVTLVGAPTLRFRVPAVGPLLGSSEPPDEARLFVKLADVSDDGDRTLIQQAVTPVRTTDVPAALDVRLPDLAYRLRADHRLQLTIATTDQAFANQLDAIRIDVGVGEDTTLSLPTAPAVPSGGSSGWWLTGGVVAVLLAGSVVAAVLRRRRPGPHAAGTPGVVDAAAPDGVRVQVSAPEPIRIRGLTKRYTDGHLAVDRLDLTVGHGQVFGLLGPNGAGKTSSVRMLLGLSRPTSGSIEVFGERMHPGHPVLARVGALVEGPGFVPELSGIDNLQLYWRAGGRPLAEADLPWALEVAALGTAIDKPIRTYSHGMRQRLAIAQALLGRPELLVLDEPTDGLDPEQIRRMRELLARLGSEGHTVLVSSHLLAEVEQMCTHVAVLQRGRLLASGSLADLVGGNHTVVVQTDDRARAREVLERHLGVGAVEASGAGLAVTLGEHEPADLVGWLVASGARIQALTPRGKLEDAFLSLTGEPAAPGPDGAAAGGAS